MSQRALWPEGVEVHQNDLAFEQTARMTEHIQRSLDEATMGVASGFGVTVNGADNTRIDVAAGTGYAPNGEYVVLDPGQSAVALASGVLGTVNYVVAVYTETQSAPQPHETGTNSPYTKANRSVRLRVYTAAQYAALPVSDDDLANDAQDRCLVVALVTATGGALTGGSIESPTAYSTINYAAQPINVTGTTITAVSSNTSAGTGTLAYAFATTELTWTPPGGAAGAAVNVGGGGTFTLSGGGGSPPTITVEVIAASLPVANASDSIVITALYSQDVPRFTADDWLHRSLLGTGTPSPTNPHGLRVSDLGGVELEELVNHRDIQHANGIWRGSSSNCLVVQVDETVAPDRLVITAPVGVDTYFVNGERLSTIVNTAITFGAAPAAATFYEVLVDATGSVSVSTRATWPNPRTVTGVEIIDMADSTAAGAKNLAFLVAGTTLAWDSGPTVNVGGGGHFRLISQNDRDWIDVFVVAASLPGGNATDAVTVAALASADTYMRIAMVAWTGSATGFLGYTSNRGVITARAIDKRFYGTLSYDDRQDEAVRSRLVLSDGTLPTVTRRTHDERNLDELRSSGVVVGLDRTIANSLAVSSGGGLNVTVAGGVAYVWGRRFERAEQTAVALSDNSTNYVYLDAEGAVQVTTALSFTQIVGDGTTGTPGVGILLARAVTAGGAITQILDYRRNITHQDNKGVFTVNGLTSASGAARENAQFFTLQAAFAYAAIYGIHEIHVVGGSAETFTAPISINTGYRVVIEPNTGFTASGAASAIFQVVTGAFVHGSLELIGGGAGGGPGVPSTFNSSIPLVDYAGGDQSHVLIRDLTISLTAELMLLSGTSVSGRGIHIENCHVIITNADDAFVFSDSFAGPFVVDTSYFDLSGGGSFLSETFGAAETISDVTLLGSTFLCPGGSLIDLPDNNASVTDWWILDNEIDVSGYVFDVRGTVTRVRIYGNSLDGDDGIYTAMPTLARTHTDVVIESNFINTAITSAAIQTGANVTCVRCSVRKNNFRMATTLGLSVQFGNAAAGLCQEIDISGNTFAVGVLYVTNATGVTINDNIFDDTSASYPACISLEDVTKFTVDDNLCDFRLSFFVISGTNQEGSISGNILSATASTAGIAIDIQAGSQFVVDGNTIRSTANAGGVTNRSGITNVAPNSVISNNAIYINETGSQTNGINNAGSRVTITGNTIVFTGGATTAGTGIFTSGVGTVITGNNVSTPSGLSNNFVGCFVNPAANGCVISGNYFPAAAAPATYDVDAQADETAFLGNVVQTAGTVGTAGIGGGGATSRGGSTMNVATVTLT